MTIIYYKSRIVLYLAVLLGLVRCTTIAEQSLSSVPRLREIQESGQLIVGTAITRPFEFYDSETNTLIGFDIDLMNHIASRLEVNIEWREMAFADLLTELQAGQLDAVIAAMYIKPERAELVDFSEPYLTTGLVMVVQADNTSITDFASLAGQTVGVKEGSTGEQRADHLRNDSAIDMTILRYETTLNSLDDLNNGLIDVVFNDALNTLEYIKTHPNIRIQGETFDPAGLGIAVKKGDTTLLDFINDTLHDLSTSGEIERLFDQWINSETAE